MCTIHHLHELRSVADEWAQRAWEMTGLLSAIKDKAEASPPDWGSLPPELPARDVGKSEGLWDLPREGERRDVLRDP